MTAPGSPAQSARGRSVGRCGIGTPDPINDVGCGVHRLALAFETDPVGRWLLVRTASPIHDEIPIYKHVRVGRTAVPSHSLHHT
jgi:hypothetical protein